MFPAEDYAIPKGSTVLVTGANGYLASHVVDILLEIGFKVRGTVRSKKPWLDKLFEQRHGQQQYQSIVVPDLAAEGAYVQAMRGVAAVVHVASDVSLRTDPETVIGGAIDSAVNILTAASKQPSIKRFVLTSSSSAAYLSAPNNKDVIIDENSYNDTIVDLAWDENTPEHVKAPYNYVASKVESEKESFDWMDENKPAFVFNSVLPSFSTGPILHSEQFGSTMGRTRNLLKGDRHATIMFPPEYFIDVRDTARLHIAALLDPSIENERIFGFVHEFNWNDAISVLHKLRPNNQRLPRPPADEWRDQATIKPKGRAEEILRSFWDRSWIGFEESLKDGIAGWQ